MQMKPTSSPQDAVPSQIIKDTFVIVGPSIQVIITFCLATSTAPTSLKHAVVQLCLKKPNLDARCLENYRPISKLSFISKVLEKVVLSQLLRFFFSSNELLEPFQSGFKALHSTETALLKVTNYFTHSRLWRQCNDDLNGIVLLLIQLTTILCWSALNSGWALVA